MAARFPLETSRQKLVESSIAQLYALPDLVEIWYASASGAWPGCDWDQQQRAERASSGGNASLIAYFVA